VAPTVIVVWVWGGGGETERERERGRGRGRDRGTEKEREIPILCKTHPFSLSLILSLPLFPSLKRSASLSQVSVLISLSLSETLFLSLSPNSSTRGQSPTRRVKIQHVCHSSPYQTDSARPDQRIQSNPGRAWPGRAGPPAARGGVADRRGHRRRRRASPVRAPCGSNAPDPLSSPLSERRAGPSSAYQKRNSLERE
jgi:hypothetical protein